MAIEWYINQWRAVHPVHDTFFIGASSADGPYRASRVYRDPGQESGLGHEFIPAVDEGEITRSFGELHEAMVAVSKRIAELDAAAEQKAGEL